MSQPGRADPWGTTCRAGRVKTAVNTPTRTTGGVFAAAAEASPGFRAGMTAISLIAEIVPQSLGVQTDKFL